MLKLPLFGAAGGPFILNLLGTPAGAAFGVRKLNGAYIGAALNVRRSSDNATLDISFLPNGSLNASAFSGFIGAGSGFVTKWYDQSGNGRDASQATAANQPQLVLNTIGGRPALKFTGSQTLATGSFAAQTTPETINAVMERTSGTTQQNAVLALNNVLAFSTANLVLLEGSSSGIFTASATDSAAHSVTGVINGSSSVINVDGTETTGTATGSAGSGALTLGSSVNGYISELILLPSTAVTSSQRTTLHSSQSAYYGTP